MSSTPDPVARLGSPSVLEAEFAAQISLLEAMFDDANLSRLRRRFPKHPAAIRYDALLAGRTIAADEDEERARAQQLAQGMIDRTTWALVPEARPFWLSTVPDPAQAIQAEKRITSPSQYGDTTLELFAWGALRYAGLAAELQERDGEPDIRLGPGYMEVKRLHLGKRPNQVKNVLMKANKQIKNASPGIAGTVLLYVETVADAATFDDAVPPDVEQYASEVRRVLGGGHGTHLGQVVVVWDDFMVHGHRPEPVLYAIRRRALVLDHMSAVSSPPGTDWVAVFGFTTTLWVRYAPTSASTQPQSVVTSDLNLTEAFHQRNEWGGGIRRAHARRVLAEPDGRVSVPLRGGGMSVELVTKRINVERAPHVMLLLGTKRDDGPLALADGFRLRGTDDQLAAWSLDPRLAFDHLLSRFGIPTSVNGGPAQLFHLAWTSSEPPEIMARGVQGPFAISAFIRHAPPQFFVDWAYAIDDKAYRASYGA